MIVMLVSKIIILLLIMGALVFIIRKNKHSMFIKIFSIIALSSWILKIIVDAYLRWQFVSLGTSSLSTMRTLVILFEAFRILSFLIIGILLRKSRSSELDYKVEKTQRKLIERKRFLDIQNK